METIIKKDKKYKFIDIIKDLSIMIILILSLAVVHELGHIFFLIVFGHEFTVGIDIMNMIFLPQVNFIAPDNYFGLEMNLILLGGLLFQIITSSICTYLIWKQKISNKDLLMFVYLYPIIHTGMMVSYLVNDLIILKIGDYSLLLNYFPISFYILIVFIIIFIIFEIYIYKKIWERKKNEKK